MAAHTIEAPTPLPLPDNARTFVVRTTRRTVEVIATSAEQASDILAGQRWPLHIPPAPNPAQENYRNERGWLCERTTAAWEAWHHAYRDDLWGRLDWATGECMIDVTEAAS